MRKYQHYNINDDNDRDGYGANWMAQTFTPVADHIIGKIKLKLFRVGDPGTIIVSIKATASGKPVGADLCSGIILGTDLTDDSNGDWYEISLGNGFDLDIGAQYAIVIKATGGDASNKVSWRADITSPTFTGGTFVSSSDSGVDWSVVSGVDCMFEEWGVGPASPTTVTWGNLFKSQISAEKIEEAINRIIQDHEDDPDAHVEVGESLYSHKASEIIDHIVSSIIEDKIARGAINLAQFSMNKLQFTTGFETFDGWEHDPTAVIPRFLGAQIATTDVLNNFTGIGTSPISGDYFLVWTKDPFFQISLQVRWPTTQLIYFGMGEPLSEIIGDFVGFKIVNATLYAVIVAMVTGSRTEYATEITGVTTTDVNVYRAEYDNANDEVKFYVNGVLKLTKEVESPLEDRSQIFTIYIKTTAAVARSIHPNYLLWSRDL